MSTSSMFLCLILKGILISRVMVRMTSRAQRSWIIGTSGMNTGTRTGFRRVLGGKR